MMKLYLDRILYPVTALGPDRRIAIWVSGCNRHCPGCANPELWERREEQRIDMDRAAGLISGLMRSRGVRALTITGGEPFEQAEALSCLLDRLDEKPEDILVFSGFRREELEADSVCARLIGKIDVLIDGEYRREENDGQSALRGSVNQRIHIFNHGLEGRYREYLGQGRQIQNFVYDYRIVSVGIHSESDGRGMKDAAGAEQMAEGAEPVRRDE